MAWWNSLGSVQKSLHKFPTMSSWTKSRPKSPLLLAIHSHLYSFVWRFIFLQTHTTTRFQLLYTVKEKRGKDRKPYPFPMVKKSIQNHAWELSRLCPETSTKLCVHEFGFCSQGCHDKLSLHEVSQNIITGIINLLDFKTQWQISPHWCVLFWPWTAFRHFHHCPAGHSLGETRAPLT